MFWTRSRLPACQWTKRRPKRVCGSSRRRGAPSPPPPLWRAARPPHGADRSLAGPCRTGSMPGHIGSADRVAPARCPPAAWPAPAAGRSGSAGGCRAASGPLPRGDQPRGAWNIAARELLLDHAHDLHEPQRAPTQVVHPALRQEQRQVVLDRLLREERQPPGNRQPTLAVERGLDFALDQRDRRLDLPGGKPVPDRRVGQRDRFEPRRGTSMEAGESVRRLLSLPGASATPPERGGGIRAARRHSAASGGTDRPRGRSASPPSQTRPRRHHRPVPRRGG